MDRQIMAHIAQSMRPILRLAFLGNRTAKHYSVMSELRQIAEQAVSFYSDLSSET